MGRTERKKAVKRTGRVIALILAAVLVIAAVYVLFILPVTYTIDPSLLVKNPDYCVYVTEKGGYTSLIKKDAAGQPIDSEFKIIGFTDVHLDTKKEKGDITMEYIIRNIVNEKPDMVVFVGDNITSAFNRSRAVQLAKIMEELGVYWDLVLGNHEGDNIWSVSRGRMVKLFAKYPHCLMEASEKKTASGEVVWGYGNHVVNLLDSGENIVRSLYFIDGGSDMSEEDMVRYDAEFADKSHNDYDYVKESQITWYLETVAIMNKLNGAPVSSTVFDHIPLPEFRLAYEALTGETEVTQNTPAYQAPDNAGNYILAGQRREAICYSGHNSGFFDAILTAGSTDSFVCGHDHINDFILCWEGILLAYNEPSGYSSYNLISKGLDDRLLQGFTEYTAAPDGTLTIEQVHNADLYPEAQDAINALFR